MCSAAGSNQAYRRHVSQAASRQLHERAYQRQTPLAKRHHEHGFRPCPRCFRRMVPADRWGQVRARSGSFRMEYSIRPGLYAIGSPDASSDIFVTANYKLSFDILRRALAGINGWILVLDTKGINVWCAAGKGTFGTEELIKRVFAAKLSDLVSHRRLIVPQLGATGVRASEVKKKTGFTVYFGPVEASDIKEYLEAGCHATPEMRKITVRSRAAAGAHPDRAEPGTEIHSRLTALICLSSSDFSHRASSFITPGSRDGPFWH